MNINRIFLIIMIMSFFLTGLFIYSCQGSPTDEAAANTDNIFNKDNGGVDTYNATKTEENKNTGANILKIANTDYVTGLGAGYDDFTGGNSIVTGCNSVGTTDTVIIGPGNSFRVNFNQWVTFESGAITLEEVGGSAITVNLVNDGDSVIVTPDTEIRTTDGTASGATYEIKIHPNLIQSDATGIALDSDGDGIPAETEDTRAFRFNTNVNDATQCSSDFDNSGFTWNSYEYMIGMYSNGGITVMDLAAGESGANLMICSGGAGCAGSIAQELDESSAANSMSIKSLPAGNALSTSVSFVVSDGTWGDRYTIPISGVSLGEGVNVNIIPSMVKRSTDGDKLGLNDNEKLNTGGNDPQPKAANGDIFATPMSPELGYYQSEMLVPVIDSSIGIPNVTFTQGTGNNTEQLELAFTHDMSGLSKSNFMLYRKTAAGTMEAMPFTFEATSNARAVISGQMSKGTDDWYLFIKSTNIKNSGGSGNSLLYNICDETKFDPDTAAAGSDYWTSLGEWVHVF